MKKSNEKMERGNISKGERRMNEHMKKNFDYDEYCDDDIVYEITPKGIAAIALSDVGLCDIFDERINTFWTIFTSMMEKYEYLKLE